MYDITTVPKILVMLFPAYLLDAVNVIAVYLYDMYLIRNRWDLTKKIIISYIILSYQIHFTCQWTFLEKKEEIVCNLIIKL